MDFIKRTIAQSEVVEKLALRAKQTKSEADIQQLEIEMEALAFYQNTAKGDPKERARHAIETARATVLGRAVTQPLSPIS